MTFEDGGEDSNIVRPKQFQSDIDIDLKEIERAAAKARLWPNSSMNLTAVKVFCGLGVIALALSAVQPSKSGEMTWISGFLMLAGGICFGIAAIYRFSKDFWK